MGRTLAAAFAAACILLLAPPLRAQAPADGAASLDESVQKAIERGVAYLWSQRGADGSWPAYSDRWTMGPTALAAYALLESGVSPQEERMAQTLSWLAGHNDYMTYSHGLRCQVWLIANRQTQNKYLKTFEADVRLMMLSASKGGAYHYDANGRGASLSETDFDNSCSQFGALGVWAGARANPVMEFVNAKYWMTVMLHWLETACADGGWAYYGTDTDSTPSMTAAGVATLFVCIDNSLSEAFVRCEVAQTREFKAVTRGMEWLDQHFQENMQEPAPYYLYGLERVGLASGMKYFGSSDWYKLGAEYLVRKQDRDGAWHGGFGGDLQATAFSLLFLIRGRNPVLFNKLQYAGDWNNRPRALASLTEWISRNFEQTVNWQIINLKVPVSEWHDAPILYLSGSKAPTFTDEELDKLRTYVQQGGTIFSVAECGGEAFTKGMRKAYIKMFPDYEMKPADKEHDLYTLQYKLKGKPRLQIVSNGVRPLAIHAEDDMVLAWQARKTASEPWAYEGAANVFLYVSDKAALRARGVNHWPEAPAAAPARQVKVARLRYGGNWDPEPLAYERFSRLLAREAGIGLEVAPTALKDLPGSGAAVATLTGTNALSMSEEDKAAIKKFVGAGGLLVVDAAGGSKTFAESAQNAIEEIFGAGSLKKLAPAAGLYAAKEIKDFKYRRMTKARLAGQKDPQLQAVMIGERPGVLFSREDLTGGLVGYSSYACDGYLPQTAYEIMRNVMVLASAGTGSPAPAASPTSQPAGKP
jgi:hypothetical protein